MASDEGVTTVPDPAATDGSSRDWMWKISQAIATEKGRPDFLGTGGRAALRRIPLTRSREADGVVVKLLHRIQVPEAAIEHGFARWRLMAHVAALLSGTGGKPAHDRQNRFGAALHEAGYSENRLLRLLGTRGEALTDQVHRAARMLATKGKPVDLWPVYHLVGDDADRADAARVRIAQDFYSAEARSK